MTQMSLLGENVGLFVGLSMEDPNIRRLIDVTHKQYPEIPNYAVLPRRESLKGLGDSKQAVLRSLYESVETNSFKEIGVQVIWVNTYDDIHNVIGEICNTSGT